MKTPLNQPVFENGHTPEDFHFPPEVDITFNASHATDSFTSDFNSPAGISMQGGATPKKIAASSEHDIQSLRLPPNYGATLGVKKLLINVPVGKPKKDHFFRTHPSDDMTFAAMLLEQKESGENYLVIHEISQVISELVRPVQLHAAIDRQNNVFLIPVPLPGESGTRNPWHESLAQAAELAKSKWLRINANRQTGSYDVYVAEGPLPEPEWPGDDIDTLIKVAFRGKIITGLDHPIVQMLLGRV